MAELELPGTINRLTDALQIRLPGVLYDMARAVLWDTVEDFCARSTWYAVGVTWSSLDVSGTTIVVPDPAGAKIHRILEIYGVSAYTIIPPNTIISFDASDVTGSALTALRPDSLDNTPVPLLETWFEALLAGALSRLYADASKPYANKDLAAAYAGLYEQSVMQAASQAVRGNYGTTTDTGSLDRLYVAVRSEIGDIPHPVLQQAAWSTVEEFCLQSTVLREPAFDWTMASGVPQVDFNPFSADLLVAWVLGYTGLTQAKIIRPAILRDLTSPTPTTTRNGQAWLALKPKSLTAAAGQTELWSAWFEAIRSGTLSRLYLQAGKPYANPPLAADYRRLYRRGIAEARGTADRGFSAGAPVAFPYFASGRRHGGVVAS